MAEWSKAPDSSSGLRERAWVQIPLLTFFYYYYINFFFHQFLTFFYYFYINFFFINLERIYM
ncbi:hypothetical protein ACSBR2_000216 [Camellia fascicularis]